MLKTLPANRFWESFGFEDLNAEELKKRTSAVNAAIFTIVAGILHSIIYVYLGFPYVTLAVLGYATCSISSLIYLRVTRNFDVFKVTQLLLISVFPFATQLFIGGFINGSAVAIGGFIAPATALLYAKRKIARRYLFLFIAFMIGVAVAEYYFFKNRAVLPVAVVITFFTINITTTLGIIYFLMESFLKKQEELRIDLRKSIEDLKATQSQLIHAEKMASLGELTAGIAHEIQNPLNFVNNFSEVSTELLQELREELLAGNTADTLALADDIILNLQKITAHGKRADSIVKGMLQHSRTNTGKKEPTDINALADEFLRLSYHGLRAKDKSFNSDFKADFDTGIGKINLVPQDIGRVFLNLCNNAFYAVNEKKQQAPEAYKPMVWLNSLQADGKIIITVKDNGNGIPQSILDKIYQPFFTTKPAGQGTGLGLSLSYDVIKAHSGQLKVDTREGQGTTFTVTLPV